MFGDKGSFVWVGLTNSTDHIQILKYDEGRQALFTVDPAFEKVSDDAKPLHITSETVPEDITKLPSRSAVEVLNDIISRYTSLEEITSLTGCIDHDQLKALYIEHGWPSQKFNGTSFAIARARLDARERLKCDSNRPLFTVDDYAKKVESDKADVFLLQEQLGSNTLASMEEKLELDFKLKKAVFEYEWMKHFHSHAVAHSNISCPNGRCFSEEDLPFLELDSLRQALELIQFDVDDCLQWIAVHLSAEDTEHCERKLRRDQPKLIVIKAAWEESRSLVEKLCKTKKDSCKNYDMESGFIKDDNDEKKKQHRKGHAALKEFEERIEVRKRFLKELQKWLPGIPEEANIILAKVRKEFEEQITSIKEAEDALPNLRKEVDDIRHNEL